MEFYMIIFIITVNLLIVLCHKDNNLSTDDLDNFINPSDFDVFNDVFSTTQVPIDVSSATKLNASSTSILSVSPATETYEQALTRNKTSALNLTESADCFGLGSLTSKLRWFFNLKPQNSDEIQVEFFIQNRKQKSRVQVMLDDQFGLEWTFFDPDKSTIVIVHGFLSYSKASWVRNMTKAFLDWDDVNVITVDWSRGGSTWKYWRAVVNTRTVGSDLARFLKQVMMTSGAKPSSFHFVGHSLGAHICSFASNVLGGVRRITGLDPAQPCFITTDLRMLLDKSDADFVDVIHTNGRTLSKIGLGVPNTCGDQDFFPNGGMKQPGCHTGKSSFFNRFLPISKAKLLRAICNHGRAYQLFTESLKNHSCSLIGHKWNLSYTTINSSIDTVCTNTTCAEMGVRADKYPARGSFYVVTTGKKPFCETIPIKLEVRQFLLNDLKSIEDKRTENMSSTTFLTPPTVTNTTSLITTSTTEKNENEKPVIKKSGWFSSIFG